MPYMDKNCRRYGFGREIKMPVTVQVVARSLQPAAEAQSSVHPPGAQLNLQEAQTSLGAQPNLAAEPKSSTLQLAAAGGQASFQSASILQELHDDEADLHISTEEMDALLQELNEEETTTKAVVSKKRRLNASEKMKIRSAVASVDQNDLQSAIVDSVSGMVHISSIEDRQLFWKHVKSSECLGSMCNHFFSEYVRLHKECDKGADKYALFYLKWYEHIRSPTHSVYFSTCRDELTKSYNKTVTEDTWTTLLTTLLYASFNAMQTIMSHHIPSTDADHVYSNASAMSEDDDVALLRLGGWALYSCMKYRKHAIKSKSKIKHTSKKLKVYQAELKILEALVDDRKIGLPSAITAQDRGYMTFPSHQ